MIRRHLLGVARVLIAGAIGAGVVVQARQAPPAPQGGRGPGGGQTVEKIRQLKPDLYMVTGGGANTLVRVTRDGLVVVDTKLPSEEIYGRLMDEIASVSNQPVKYVLNTHHHPDHVGNNQRFVDRGAQIVGLEALKTYMTSDPRTKDIPGPPTVTFAKDDTLKIGGIEVQAHAFGRGHTGDDTMVYFPDLKVVMVSDQITDNTPIVDFANGGSAIGWTEELDGVLGLDFEMAIPGRGEPEDSIRRPGVQKPVCDARQPCVGCDQGRRLEGPARLAGQGGRPRVGVQPAVLRPAVRRSCSKVGGAERSSVVGGNRSHVEQLSCFHQQVLGGERLLEKLNARRQEPVHRPQGRRIA